MKKIELIKKLGEYPLFTFNEFVRISGKTLVYARNYIYRLKKDSLLSRIERGKYTLFDDSMIFSSYIQLPSYISFWTALRFYDFTEQLPSDIMVASSKSRKTILFQDTKIRFFKTKYLWGYKKKRYMNFDIFLAEREKAILDSMLLKNVPFDEIVNAIKTKKFDRKKIVNYAIRIGNNSLIKRLGYLMESTGLESEKLLSVIDNNYISLDWNKKKKGKKIKKWKIILNTVKNDIF